MRLEIGAQQLEDFNSYSRQADALLTQHEHTSSRARLLIARIPATDWLLEIIYYIHIGPPPPITPPPLRTPNGTEATIGQADLPILY
jgi:hypothetical protein